ncbi:MAG: hypothetical protein IAX22_00500 [Candidatus Bathyarchaeota archaeon]|nr:hypothetical protein [Candidatus Bathyarchaeota archaeon]
MKIPSENCIKKIQEKLIDWGNCHFVQFPWRTTENKFHGLVAEILLQRTRAEQVVPVFESFTQLFPTVETASKESIQVIKTLKPLGLEWRAKKVVELISELNRLKIISESRDELMKLPGVGSYAASAFLSFHASQRAVIVDSNSVRLWSRVFGFKSDGETRRKRWFTEIVERLTPVENNKQFNYAILDLTRAVCKQKPNCQICPINFLCCYFRNAYSKEEIKSALLKRRI